MFASKRFLYVASLWKQEERLYDHILLTMPIAKSQRNREAVGDSPLYPILVFDGD